MSSLPGQPYEPPTDAGLMMRYDANKRSVGIAYLLWFFLGYLGIHRFYLKRTASAVVMLLLGLISLPFTLIGVGFVGFILVGIWWCVDALLMPGMTRDYNNRLISTLRG